MKAAPKFMVGDLVNCDNYEMDGCCHDCEGTSHYLEYDEFIIERIKDGEAFHKDCEYGYELSHLKLIEPAYVVNSPLYKALK